MKLYGIFDKLDGYRLLRYSTAEANESINIVVVPGTYTTKEVHEVCIPDIEYSETNLGKRYNIQTGTFEE